jgi:hypothetical protein
MVNATTRRNRQSAPPAVEAAPPASPVSEEPDPVDDVPDPDEAQEIDPYADWAVLDQEVPPTAGHGPARAAALYAVAETFGAVLDEQKVLGSTRSTGPGEGVHIHLRVPNAADVRTMEDVFSQVELAMEDVARVRRAKAREVFKEQGTLAANTYALNLTSRSSMVGFGQGVAAALASARGAKITRPDGAPTPLKAARFRNGNVDESALKSARAAGRKWAQEHLLTSSAPQLEVSSPPASDV